MLRFVEGVVKGDAYLPGIIWGMWADELPFVLPWEAIDSFQTSMPDDDDDEPDTECPYCGTMYPYFCECHGCGYRR